MLKRLPWQKVPYAANIKNIGVDKMCWKPSLTKRFQVKSYYQVLSANRTGVFPWKISPPRVAFFSWTTAFGKILTADDLR